MYTDMFFPKKTTQLFLLSAGFLYYSKLVRKRVRIFTVFASFLIMEHYNEFVNNSNKLH